MGGNAPRIILGKPRLPNVASASMLARCPIEVLDDGNAPIKCAHLQLSDKIHLMADLELDGCECVRGETRISDEEFIPGVRVVAQPDFLCRCGDKVVIAELKVCRTECNVDPYFTRQLAMFAFVFKEASEGILILVDTSGNVVRTVRLSRDALDRLINMIRRAWLNHKPLPSDIHCRHCRFVNSCVFAPDAIVKQLVRN